MREFATGLGIKSRPVFGDRRLGKRSTWFCGGSPWLLHRAVDKYHGRKPWMNSEGVDYTLLFPTNGRLQAGKVFIAEHLELWV